MKLAVLMALASIVLAGIVVAHGSPAASEPMPTRRPGPAPAVDDRPLSRPSAAALAYPVDRVALYAERALLVRLGDGTVPAAAFADGAVADALCTRLPRAAAAWPEPSALTLIDRRVALDGADTRIYVADYGRSLRVRWTVTRDLIGRLTDAEPAII